MFKIRLLMYGVLFSSLLCHWPADIQAQNRSKASRYYQQGIQALNNYNFREAVQLLSRTLRYDSSYTTAFSKRGIAAYHSTDYSLAYTDFHKALQRKQVFSAETWFYKGLTAFALQKHEEAIADLQQSVTLDFNNPRAFGYLAESHKALQQLDKALYYYQQALSLTPQEAILLVGRGQCYRLLDQPITAIADFDRALVFHPTNVTAYLERALARFTLQRYAAARDDFLQVETLLDTLTSQNYSMLAFCYAAEEDHAKALKAIGSAIQQDSTESWWYHERANYNLQIENYGSALADCRKACTLDPTETTYVQQQATILITQADYEQALPILDYVIQQEPDNAQAFYQRALVKQQLRAKRKSIKADLQQARTHGLLTSEMSPSLQNILLKKTLWERFGL
ncbi:MAG: tetratricopeptide repeat protein [Bacteroidota bacterium]